LQKTPDVASPAPPIPPPAEKISAPVPPAGPPASTTGDPETGPVRKGVRKHWEEFIDYVMDRKKWMAHALRLSSGSKEEEGSLVLKYDALSDCKVLQEPENIKFLTEFAQDFFQRELKIKFNIPGSDVRDGNNQENSGPQEERRALAQDPLVLAATEIFGGQVTNIRTGPRSR